MYRFWYEQITNMELFRKSATNQYAQSTELQLNICMHNLFKLVNVIYITKSIITVTSSVFIYRQ